MLGTFSITSGNYCYSLYHTQYRSLRRKKNCVTCSFLLRRCRWFAELPFIVSRRTSGRGSGRSFGLFLVVLQQRLGNGSGRHVAAKDVALVFLCDLVSSNVPKVSAKKEGEREREGERREREIESMGVGNLSKGRQMWHSSKSRHRTHRMDCCLSDLPLLMREILGHLQEPKQNEMPTYVNSHISD